MGQTKTGSSAIISDARYRVKVINKELLTLGYKPYEIEVFWQECFKEAKLKSSNT